MINIRFLMQWHITEQCSNHCKHCYNDFNNKAIQNTIADFSFIINSFIDFLNFYNTNYNRNQFVKGHINITGGDPLMHTDFSTLLELLYEKRKYFSYGILANATYIDETMILAFKKFGAEFIQLSLDGNNEVNDQLRGAGDFKRTNNALAILKKNKIKSYVSFTVNQQNYWCFNEVAAICKKYKVAKLWTDRYIPVGNGALNNGLLLSSEKFYEFVRHANALKKGMLNLKKSNIFLERALMFQATGEKPYHCSAGKALLAIMPDGTVYPCRRLPVSCGNIFQQTLIDIYQKNEFLLQMQNPIQPGVCKSCSWYVYCKAGARCMTYAIKGDVMEADPDCAIAKLYIS